MTNNILGFDIGGVKGIIDTNTTIKRLTFSSTSTAALSAHSLIDMSTGAAYVVPASKKTKLMYFTNWAPIGNDGVGVAKAGNVIYADAANSTTNGVILWGPGTLVTLTAFIFVSAAAPAGKYINFNRSADPGTKAVDVYALEEAA